MNDDQLTAIAREYAEEVYRNAHKEMEVLPNCLSNEAINIFAEDMEHKVQWLLRRFCLVEKFKATELCRLTLEHGDSVGYGLIDGLTDIVRDIFPEQYQQVADNPGLGKEVENG